MLEIYAGEVMSKAMQNFRYVNGKAMKINKENVFDAYFTKPEIAKNLYETACQVIAKYENVSKYTWLEPSVGDGCFYKLLDKEKRIGIDIQRTAFDSIETDFLDYELPEKPLIVIGNPPFGHRGVLALKFIEHAHKAEFIAFILPMFFQSLGKGSIRYRVKGFHLLYEQNLPQNSFYTADGKDKDVKCCFQIWSKNHKNPKNEFSWYRQKEKQEPFNEILKVITVSLAKNRECGKEWIFNKKADFYLSSTFFKQNAVVDSFDKVKYKSGIAIIYTTQDTRLKARLNSLFLNADWLTYSTQATNGCYHIGKSHIFQLLSDKGYNEYQ